MIPIKVHVSPLRVEGEPPSAPADYECPYPLIEGDYMLIGFSGNRHGHCAVLSPISGEDRGLVLANMENHLIEPSNASALSIDPDDLPVGEVSLAEFAASMERAFIAATLAKTGNNKAQAAAALGVSIATLYRKLGQKPPSTKIG